MCPVRAVLGVSGFHVGVDCAVCGERAGRLSDFFQGRLLGFRRNRLLRSRAGAVGWLVCLACLEATRSNSISREMAWVG